MSKEGISGDRTMMPSPSGTSRRKYASPTKRADYAKLSLNTSDKATRRVIAPYVNIIRRGKKAIIAQPESKHFSFYLQKKPSVLMKQLTESLADSIDLPMLLHETIDAVKCITNAMG